MRWIDILGLEKFILFPNSLKLSAVNGVPDKPGIFTVYGHGNFEFMSGVREKGEKLNAEKLKNIIENDPRYVPGIPIELFSC